MIFVSCEKKSASKQMAASDANQMETGKVNPTNSANINALPTPVAYLTECTVNGACGGPQLSKNSSLRSFFATTGTNETLIQNNCDYIASAYNYNNGLLYAVTKTPVGSGGDYLYSYNIVTNTWTNLTALFIGNSEFHVNEMEFGSNGDLYLLREGNAKELYKVNLNTNLVSLVGSMFGILKLAFKEALAYNPVSNKLYLVYDTGTSLPTKVSEINITTAALSNTINYNIPNPFTNNISAYFSGVNLRIMRDDNAGLAKIYDTNGLLLNTVSCRATHDATSNGLSNP